MARFEKATASGLTVAECDRLALENAGRVLSTGYGFTMPRGGDINEEYSARVINTRGMGNHGTVILVGKTPRARRLLWKGRVRYLVAHGISPEVARAAASMRYGMEVEVAKLAEEILPLVRVSEFIGHSNRDFALWCGCQSRLPFPRKIAALAIARRVARKRGDRA